MADAGVSQYTFHIEPVIKDVLPICRKIREAGMKVGLALKPGTGIEAVRQYIDHADMILIMTVEPGRFISHSELHSLKDLIWNFSSQASGGKHLWQI